MDRAPHPRRTPLALLPAVALLASSATASTLLHYDFTNGSGTSVTDKSGSGNHGTLVDFGNTSSGAGAFGVSEGWIEGGGLSFLDDGTRSYVSTPLSQSEINGGSFTVEFMASADGPDGWTPAIGSSHGPGFDGNETFFLGLSQQLTHMEVRVPPDGGGVDQPDVPIPWSLPSDQSDPASYHVALTFDAATNEFALFVDGVSMGSETRSALFSAASEFIVGNTGHAAGEQWDGIIYGVAISDVRLSPDQFVLLSEAERFIITEITPSADNAVSLTWTSTPGQFYNVQRSADLLDWQDILSELPATDGPAETTTAPFEREAFAAFYRVARAEAPAALETGFEDGAPGWTASLVDGFAATATSWEVGVPSNGPGAAHSGENAYGTGLAADYAEGTAIALRSPPIDLAGTTNVRLTFWHYLDIVEGEGGRVNMLEEDGSLIQNLEALFATEALNTTEWTEFSLRLPNLEPARPFRLEFQFLSGGDATPNRAGWFIDDVRVGR